MNSELLLDMTQLGLESVQHSCWQIPFWTQSCKQACAKTCGSKEHRGPSPPHPRSHPCLWRCIYFFWLVVFAWFPEWPHGKSSACIWNCFAGLELRFSTSPLLCECLCHFCTICLDSVSLQLNLILSSLFGCLKWSLLKIDFHRKNHLFYYAWHAFI